MFEGHKGGIMVAPPLWMSSMRLCAPNWRGFGNDGDSDNKKGPGSASCLRRIDAHDKARPGMVVVELPIESELEDACNRSEMDRPPVGVEDRLVHHLG